MGVTKQRGLIIPNNYTSKLDILETEAAIKLAKDTFERELAEALNLTRVSAPLFVRPETGLNDDLNGIERPVQFDILNLNADVQIVQSLAKWKRMALKNYGFAPNTGLYTDMNAIRRDEDLDNLHSVYVDQWDWELVISREERNIDTLKEIVKKIWAVFIDSQNIICERFPALSRHFAKEIKFITTQELLDRYPDKTDKEREKLIAKEYGAVFIMQIGCNLSNGKPHDGRAPDYDDWTMNGDILVWYEPLDRAVELSSMGVRVDRERLLKQLEERNAMDRTNLLYHKLLLEDKLPLTIGGGIGQSRICMVLLEKVHVGEVQASVWPDEMLEITEANGIHLL